MKISAIGAVACPIKVMRDRLHVIDIFTLAVGRPPHGWQSFASFVLSTPGNAWLIALLAAHRFRNLPCRNHCQGGATSNP